MDAEKCRILLKVIALGSMSAAAEELGYTPGGISYIIDALEKELDLKLVKRSRAGISLTPEGKQLLPYLNDYIKTEKKIFEKAAAITKNMHGQIAIGTFPSIGRLIMPEVIQRFKKVYPNITIRTFEGINEHLEKELRRNEVDFCICSARLKNYDWIPLREDPLVCVLNENHPLAKMDAIPIERIKGEKFILADYGKDSNINNFLEKYNIDPEIVGYTLEPTSAYGLVKKNMGITIINELATIDQTIDVAIRPFDPPEIIQEGIVIPSLADANQCVRQFIQFVMELVPSTNKSLLKENRE